MKKNSRDRRISYRANRKYYLNLIKEFATEKLFKFPDAKYEPQIAKRGLLFYSENKNDLPKFIDIDKI